MRPIILSGHTRALTQVKFSKEGDFLFTVSKDHVICAWYSDNGERRGTYEGHKGAIWSVDPNPSTTLLATGSADNTMRLWNIETGKLVKTWEYPTAVKRVEFSEDGKLLLCITEKRMGYMSNIYVYDVIDDPEATQTDEPTTRITVNDLPRVTMAGISALNRYIITGHEDGSISQYDLKSGEFIDNVQRHEDCINDLQWNADRTFFITASKDKTAKLHDWDSLRTMKTYLADAPVNSATITDENYVVLGGGQAAMDVTTTSARQGKFEARFHSLVFEEEVARVRLHFGPLNTLAYKNGICCSGSEDGYVKLLHMDRSFHTFKFEVERERELTSA